MLRPFLLLGGGGCFDYHNSIRYFKRDYVVNKIVYPKIKCLITRDASV